MVKNALEPSWEARFEASSYGFRPGRGCHDAIASIFIHANPKNLKKWVVDADIKGCFDNIDHEFLLKVIGPVPGRELIKQWLKAGYVDKNVFYEKLSGKSFLAFCKSGLEHGDANHVLRRPRQDFHILG
jgi:RNA-directed DNA polymerase